MSTSALPQGFSIFQPALGAQLQFFPAVGTQELDELIHAHLPGAASSQEKRATLALDFFEHSQLTGQSFKFYPVYAAPSPTVSAASSFNASPVTTSWDWSQTSRAASVSSRSSQQHRVSKPTSPASRVRTTDFSNLPGMKIMTKDGIDVTNSASRGSKTKEQRDHAHLMRIIKACDSCKRKKIRCDPSHKKRSASSQSTAPAVPRVNKKARTASPPTAAQTVSPSQSISPHSSASPPLLGDEELARLMTSPFELDASFSFDNLDTLAPAASLTETIWDDFGLTDLSHSWDQFVQFPESGEVENYDFFADPASYLSSPSLAPDELAIGSLTSPSPQLSGTPPGRSPDGGPAPSHPQELSGAELGGLPSTALATGVTRSTSPQQDVAAIEGMLVNYHTDGTGHSESQVISTTLNADADNWLATQLSEQAFDHYDVTAIGRTRNTDLGSTTCQDSDSVSPQPSDSERVVPQASLAQQQLSVDALPMLATQILTSPDRTASASPQLPSSERFVDQDTTGVGGVIAPTTLQDPVAVLATASEVLFAPVTTVSAAQSPDSVGDSPGESPRVPDCNRLDAQHDASTVEASSLPVVAQVSADSRVSVSASGLAQVSDGTASPVTASRLAQLSDGGLAESDAAQLSTDTSRHSQVLASTVLHASSPAQLSDALQEGHDTVGTEMSAANGDGVCSVGTSAGRDRLSALVAGQEFSIAEAVSNDGLSNVAANTERDGASAFSTAPKGDGLQTVTASEVVSLMQTVVSRAVLAASTEAFVAKILQTIPVTTAPGVRSSGRVPYTCASSRHRLDVMAPAQRAMAMC